MTLIGILVYSARVFCSSRSPSYLTLLQASIYPSYVFTPLLDHSDCVPHSYLLVSVISEHIHPSIIPSAVPRSYTDVDSLLTSSDRLNTSYHRFGSKLD
jgi:hypothetical protein